MLAENEALKMAGMGHLDSVEVAPERDDRWRAPVRAREEARLIARLKAGEIDAFDQLVEEYQALVHALTLRILGNAEDARDATQETFLKVFRHFAHFRGEASLKTWICRIALNQARSMERWWLRRRRDRTTSLDAPALPGEEDILPGAAIVESDRLSPEAEMLWRERGREIERALAQLKIDYRLAVILRDLQGLTYEEIAYVTGASLGTVKSRLARGREMLRDLLRQ